MLLNLFTIKISRLQDTSRHQCCRELYWQEADEYQEKSQSCISGTFIKAGIELDYLAVLPNTVSSISMHLYLLRAQRTVNSIRASMGLVLLSFLCY